jgi:hypothetical protein
MGFRPPAAIRFSRVGRCSAVGGRPSPGKKSRTTVPPLYAFNRGCLRFLSPDRATDNVQIFRRGIPPGEYKLFAWDTIEPNAWLNPEFMLDDEELGAAATVGPSEKLSAQIRLIPERRQ